MNAQDIRRLFLEPKTVYSIAEAAALLGMELPEVRSWIEAGEMDVVDASEGLRLPWGEVVSFGMEIWSQKAVEEALGEDLAEAIPELMRLAGLEVRIPRIEVVALERLAARDNKSVDAVLARELLDLVSAHSEWLAGEILGFAEALRWPSGE